MDGFAIRSADVPDGGTELRVVAAVAAGAAPLTWQPGQAAPIMTGAMMPPGRTPVVPIEQAIPMSSRQRASGHGQAARPSGPELRPRRGQRHPQR